MAYNPYPYGGYQPTPGYYPGPVPDQLAQLRQNQQIPAQPQMMRDRRKFCVNDKKGQYEKQRLSQEWK